MIYGYKTEPSTEKLSYEEAQLNADIAASIAAVNSMLDEETVVMNNEIHFSPRDSSKSEGDHVYLLQFGTNINNPKWFYVSEYFTPFQPVQGYYFDARDSGLPITTDLALVVHWINQQRDDYNRFAQSVGYGDTLDGEYSRSLSAKDFMPQAWKIAQLEAESLDLDLSQVHSDESIEAEAEELFRDYIQRASATRNFDVSVYSYKFQDIVRGRLVGHVDDAIAVADSWGAIILVPFSSFRKIVLTR